MTLPDLAPSIWVLLAVAAALVGISKTAIPGINTISIAIFASVLPARPSTGALLLLLIVGDVFALLSYRKHAHWPTLLRLIPAVLAGLVLGALFLAFTDDSWVRRVIGVILLLVVGLTLLQRARQDRRAGATPSAPSPETSPGGGTGAAPAAGPLVSAAYGGLGGFTTMVANAGGPVMSMYFLAARFPVHAFLGTAAWFFAVINLIKLPVSIGLGLITPETLTLDLLLVPAVVVGALFGRWIASRIPQRAFNWAVTGCTILGAAYLIFS